MCLLPGVPRGTEGTFDEVKALKVSISQVCGGKGAFHSSLLFKAFL